MKFSKKLFLLTSLLAVSVVMAKKTKKIQILVAPGDSSYIFALNAAGAAIIYDSGAPRPQGSYYVTNGFIFPGGTVSKHQTDFSVDRHGNPINLNDNLGMAYITETLLQDVDFGTPPAAGTVIEASQVIFDFKRSCDDHNTLSAIGLTTFEMFPPQVGEAVLRMIADVVGGSGCNQDHSKNSFTSKTYLPQTGSMAALIQIEFDKEIEYKD